MKLLSCLLVVFATSWIDIGDIAKVNKAKEEAATAFKNGHFAVAVKRYKYLVDELKVNEEQVLLNYAHACYNLKDTAATALYNSLLKSKNDDIRSISNQQLGMISAKTKNYEQSLNHFKQALRDQPGNHEARTNFEIVKKLLDQQRQQQQQQQNQQNKDQQNQQKQDQQKKDQEKKDQENKDQQQKESPPDKDQKAEKQQKEKDQQKDGQKKEGEEQDEKEEDKAKKENKEAMEKRSQRLQKMNMTEQQAKMILDAMKNNEAQYLQQLQRKTTKRPDKGKPDW